jgi:hypothetical protein
VADRRSVPGVTGSGSIAGQHLPAQTTFLKAMPAGTPEHPLLPFAPSSTALYISTPSVLL